MYDSGTRERARSPGLVRTTIALTLLVLAAGLAWSEEIGRCVTVQLPHPVMLPDGSVHKPKNGKFTLCVTRRGPAIGYHEIRLDGMTHSMVQSRISLSEGTMARQPALSFQRTRNGAWVESRVSDWDRPVVVFQKKTDAPWVLIGYAWPDGGRLQNYSLYSVPTRKARLQAKNTKPLDLWDHEGTVLLAAGLGGR